MNLWFLVAGISVILFLIWNVNSIYDANSLQQHQERRITKRDVWSFPSMHLYARYSDWSVVSSVMKNFRFHNGDTVQFGHWNMANASGKTLTLWVDWDNERIIIVS